MVFTIGIILILGFGLLSGLRRGFVVEILHLVGFVVATFVSVLYTTPVADFINGLIGQTSSAQSTSGIIKWIVFVLLFGLVWQIVRLLRDIITPITKLPIIHQLNSLLGGVANLIIKYLVIFILLNILLIFPSQTIHEQYQDSSISQWIVKKTPLLSDKMIQIWDENSSEINV